MKTYTIKAFDIKYDTDGEAIDLPADLILTIEAEDIDDLENKIADAVSDETGFCVFSCDYKIIAE